LGWCRGKCGVRAIDFPHFRLIQQIPRNFRAATVAVAQARVGIHYSGYVVASSQQLTATFAGLGVVALSWALPCFALIEGNTWAKDGWKHLAMA
jgi:hypothetical protein